MSFQHQNTRIQWFFLEAPGLWLFNIKIEGFNDSMDLYYGCAKKTFNEIDFEIYKIEGLSFVCFAHTTYMFVSIHANVLIYFFVWSDLFRQLEL